MTDIDGVYQALLVEHPQFSPLEREVGLALYRHLTLGEPVRREWLAKRLGQPTARVAESLQGPGLRGLVLYDEQHRIVGFGGLSIQAMATSLVIGERKLYTWCAWDSLFIPPLLGVVASAEGTCPATGERVSLEVSPSGVRNAHPATLGLTFVTPRAGLCCDDPREGMAIFCDMVRFVRDPAAGTHWLGPTHGGVLTPETAFALGVRFNRFRWGIGASPDAVPSRLTSA